MKFLDKFVFKQERFSVGVEEQTGRFYLSIPVSNQFVDYEEFYELPAFQFNACPNNIEELKEFAAKCRARQCDDKLLQQPGRLRGTPPFATNTTPWATADMSGATTTTA
jgi:hypothetical protein